MAKYRVVLMVEGSRIQAVTAMAKSLFQDQLINVSKVDPASSRQDRLNAISQQVQDCANDVDELKNELEEWKDNLPESLQESMKASELEDSIAALEELKDTLEGVDFTSISFPGMY